MSFDFDPIYLLYILIAASAGLFVEGAYLLVFSGASYRKNVNRRLKLLRNEPSRENVLVQLRKERGLTSEGNYRVGLEVLNRMVLQSGLTMGVKKLVSIPGITHYGIYKEARDRAQKEAIAWFGDHLKARPEASSQK